MKRLLGVLLAGTLVLGGLSGCAQAEFEVSQLTITPGQVVPGETFTVSAEIKNVGGADGVYTATLTVNDIEVATKDIAVASGVTEKVSFTLTEETPGNYDVTLNDMKASFTVLKLPSAQEIVDGVIEALDGRRSYEFEMDMSLDGTGKFEGEPIKATMTLVASGALDPENRQMRFAMTVNVAPWFGDEMAMAAEMYLVGNMAYMMEDFPETGSTWRKEEIPEADLEVFIEQMSKQYAQLTEPHTELLQAAQVRVIGSEKVKGVDCYVLQLTPDVQQLWQWVMQQTAPGVLLAGEEILPYEDQIAQGFLQERLSFSVKQWVAKDTYFLIRAEIDMAIELTPEALGAETAQMNIDFTMSYLAYNYNQPISIVVPPEAEAAATPPMPVPTPVPAPAPAPPPAPAPLPSPETVITFPDGKLKDAIRKALGKPSGEDLTVAELSKLTELNADSMVIADLSGIEHCVNLIDLSLYKNQISDISALSSLTNLTKLRLHKNQISDISALSSLTNLESLVLDGNQVSDISALSSLTNLKILTLGENQISDISALSSLTKIYMLGLPWNQISDISALASLTSLINLFLMQNQISDISPLSSLIKLSNLLIYGNQISDISPLVENSGLGKGDRVDLENNNLDLSEGSEDMENIKALEDRGVEVDY